MQRERQSMRKIWFISLFILLLAFVIWAFIEIPVISPIDDHATFQFLKILPSSEKKKIVYGFLPYWNLKSFALQPELTQLSYFSLTIGADGKIVSQTEDGGEPGLAKLSSEELSAVWARLDKNQQSFEITISQFANDDIWAFLNSSLAQENLFSSLDSLLLAYPIAGINLDLEYSGENSAQLRTKFTQFVQRLRQRLGGTVNLSISVYASAAKEDSVWDLATLQNYVNYFVVMAYDFHQKSSPQAGPVAPIFGGREFWDSDISKNLQLILKKVPVEKILLGVPFYGYEWQTTSRQAQAHTFAKTGATASYKRVQEILNQKEKLQVEEGWNEAALSPFISYLEMGKIYVIYFENSRSLSYKLDLVNQLDLAGVAIWALGYEGDSRELWEVIKNKF